MRFSEAYRRRSGGRVPSSRVRDNDYFSLGGGLNLEDSPLTIKPGELLGCKNYEPGIRGGYTRFGGIERFTGQTAPSASVYTIVEFDAGVEANYPAVDDTVDGDTSGAQGVVKAIVFGETEAGVSGADTVGYLILVGVSGTFQDNEDLSESATVFGVVNGAPTSTATEDSNNETWAQYAADYQRALMDPVPGSGRIRGVWFYNGKVYAFRDNAGATACVMHESTTSGWSAVTLDPKLRFVSGATEIAIGDTLTGATSGASAEVLRIGTRSGDWATGDMTGFVILGTITGGPFQNGENLQVSAATVAVASGASFTQTLTAGGRYEFRTNNFFGHSSTLRMYGVNGLNPCFEYDSVDGVFCQIDTGMTTDAPSHIAAHKDMLALMFDGGSIQVSGISNPHHWRVRLGALELATGGDGQGFLEEIGQAGNQSLFCFNRNETYVLTGTNVNDFQLLKFGPDTGAREWTIQRIGQGVFLDDMGFSTLAAVDAFGNFVSSTFSQKIQSLVNALRSMAIDSHVRRDRNLYRCAFSDNRIISVGFSGRKVTGITVVNLDMPMRCSCSEEDTDGTERTFFGSDDGHIYEISDALRDLDGEELEYFLRLSFHFSKTPSRQKRYRRAEVDIRTDSRVTTLLANVDYSSADPAVNFQPTRTLQVSGGGGFWDISEWGEFQWDAGINQQGSFKLEGSGTNISLGFYQSTRDELPHTIYGVTLHHSMRRLNRGTNVT